MKNIKYSINQKLLKILEFLLFVKMWETGIESPNYWRVDIVTIKSFGILWGYISNNYQEIKLQKVSDDLEHGISKPERPTLWALFLWSFSIIRELVSKSQTSIIAYHLCL